MAQRGRVEEKGGGGQTVGGGHVAGRGWGRRGGPAPWSGSVRRPAPTRVGGGARSHEIGEAGC
jgi:hypothetical protein